MDLLQYIRVREGIKNLFNMVLRVQGRLQITLSWSIWNDNRCWCIICLDHDVVGSPMESFNLQNLRIVVGLSSRILRRALQKDARAKEDIADFVSMMNQTLHVHIHGERYCSICI